MRERPALHMRCAKARNSVATPFLFLLGAATNGEPYAALITPRSPAVLPEGLFQTLVSSPVATGMLGSEPALEQTLGGKHRGGALRAGRSRLPSRTVAGAEEPDENKEVKCGQSRGEKVFVGVDVSKKMLDVYFRPLGERLSVENSPAGHAQLAERCKALNVEVIVFESTASARRSASWRRRTRSMRRSSRTSLRR